MQVIQLEGCVQETQGFLKTAWANLRRSEDQLQHAPFQLLEYQMIWWVCRFDTLGKLVSAHRAGVKTTPGWSVTPTRSVRLAAAAPPPQTGWG